MCCINVPSIDLTLKLIAYIITHNNYIIGENKLSAYFPKSQLTLLEIHLVKYFSFYESHCIECVYIKTSKIIAKNGIKFIVTSKNFSATLESISILVRSILWNRWFLMWYRHLILYLHKLFFSNSIFLLIYYFQTFMLTLSK